MTKQYGYGDWNVRVSEERGNGVGFIALDLSLDEPVATIGEAMQKLALVAKLIVLSKKLEPDPDAVAVNILTPELKDHSWRDHEGYYWAWTDKGWCCLGTSLRGAPDDWQSQSVYHGGPFTRVDE